MASAGACFGEGAFPGAVIDATGASRIGLVAKVGLLRPMFIEAEDCGHNQDTPRGLG